MYESNHRDNMRERPINKYLCLRDLLAFENDQIEESVFTIIENN